MPRIGRKCEVLGGPLTFVQIGMAFAMLVLTLLKVEKANEYSNDRQIRHA
jgi:hypothetical protein